MALTVDEEAPAPVRIDVSCPDALTVVVTLAGEADLCAASGRRPALFDAVTADRPHVVVDLDQLTFMDASTLGVLVAARRRASAAGKLLTVRCGPRQARLLTTTGLTCLLDHGTGDPG